MKKVMIIVGTRPELIRLSILINKIEEYYQLCLVHTGQNYDYELNEIFFKDLSIREPDYYLKASGNNLGQTMGNVIAESYNVMINERPDALLVLGDTNSALSVISAKRLKIPIFHMEAGNRCFDLNVPEEINRKIVDHTSDINLAYTENARKYLISEGINRDFVYVTGSPMTEVLESNKDRINKSSVLKRLNLEKNKYFVVSAHREENLDIDNNFNQLINSLNCVADKYPYPVIFSTHPRTKKKLDEKNIKLHKRIQSVKPLGFFDYIFLQKNSFCTLSDSGTISEEASILGFPAVSIRNSSERPEALDAGTIVLGGVEESGIMTAITIATNSINKLTNKMVPDYQDTNVSEKIIRIMHSYTRIVDERTWRKK